MVDYLDVTSRRLIHGDNAVSSWWRSRTLRFRLAVWYAVGGALLLAAFSATLYGYVAQRVARPLGLELRQDLAEVRRQLQLTPEGGLTWQGKPLMPQPNAGTHYPWFEVWDDNGHLVARLWPFSGHVVTELPAAPTHRSEAISIFYIARDIRLRTLSAPFQPNGRGAGWMIRVMRIHESAVDALGALRWIMLIALPTVIALLVLGGYAVTRRWLSPLAAMVAEAKKINPEDRARRLPVLNPQDELGQLARVFNESLDRLQSAFDTLDRFAGDASHELRTPLATLRSVGEMGLRCSTNLREANEVIISMLEEAHRLEMLVQRLLELASAEGGAMIPQREPFAVDECVLALADDFQDMAARKGQRIIVESKPCVVASDAVLFRQALHNLLENATKYSPDGSTIRLEMTIAERTVSIAVSDEGPGIRPEDRSALMNRFFRPSHGRDRESGGYGLGLSITKAYMQVLGGTVSYSPREQGGSTFQLCLPR
jgi:signal transduction histidine kinase